MNKLIRIKMKYFIGFLSNNFVLESLISITIGFLMLPHAESFAYSGTDWKTKIALISDRGSDELGRTFQFAISEANRHLRIPLVGLEEEINYGDSIQGYRKVCRFIQSGIGAIIGPSSKQTALHLMNLCDAKDIPYINSHMSMNDNGYNLYPHPYDIAKLLHAIIEEFKWSRLIFLYESSNYLSILNGLLAFYHTGGPVISVMRYDLKLNGNYKAVLRRIRKSIDNHIVVVGSSSSVAELLKQAQQVGIMNEDYKYIIGNLDLQTFELEEYKYSGANITGIRMFSPDHPIVETLLSEIDYNTSIYKNNGSTPINLEMSLTYDAVLAFAETTKNLAYRPKALNCTEKNVQEDGSTFKNYLRSLDFQQNTLTGRIYFEGNIRRAYTIDLIELQPTGLVKIGTWIEGSNLIMQRIPLKNLDMDVSANSLTNKTFQILISVPNKPYASLIESHKKLYGNNQYEGYGVDLIKELAHKLGFNYTLINGGNDYGSFNKTTNVTTGMLKDIVEGNADLAVTDLTITSERQEVIEFSIPFMNLGIAILYIKPQKSPPALFSFMDPFSSEVWLYLGLAYLGVSLSFFVLGRLSPTEWDNPYPCIEEPEELENQFTIGNSLWFTTGALLQQGSEVAPKAFSTRIVASIWWFFILIMVASYTANLAAFLTIENPTGLINSVDDLAKNKGGVQYGAKRTGSTRNYFLTSDDERYIKMNQYFLDNPQFLTETNQEGVDRVKVGTQYAFLMESTSIEYNTMRECNLMKVGGHLDEKSYAIAMRKNWPYRDKLNSAILELQEQGVLAQIKNKWWNEVGAGVCNEKTDADSKPLDLDNLAGVYFVFGIGSSFSVVYGIGLWCIYVARKSGHYEVPFMDAFLEEIKFFINLSNHDRHLKSAQSVYSRSRNSSISFESLETDSDDGLEEN